MASAPTVDPRPDVTLTADGLTLEWAAPPAHWVTQDAGRTAVVIPGYPQSSRPGAPELPFASVLIALPPGTTPEVRILSVEETERVAPGQLPIAPRPDGVLRDGAGAPIGGAYGPAIETVAASPDPIELEILGVVRGVRLARVTFYPVRPAGDHLRIVTSIRVSIAFNSRDGERIPPLLTTHPERSEAKPKGCRQERGVGGEAECDQRLPSPSLDDSLLTVVRSAVVNPDQVQPAPPATLNHSQLATRNPQSPLSTSPFAIEVTTPGLTALTYAALSAAGFPVNSADPGKLHLTRNGVEIAAEWDGDGDVTFENGERLLFYAAPRFSRYSSSDVYFLLLETTPGLRLSNRSADPSALPAGRVWLTATAEVNALYTPDCFCGPLPPGRDGDRWTWDDVRRPDRANPSYPIQLPTVNATQPATLTVYFIGYTDPVANPDHRVDASLNNAPLGRVEWNGRAAIAATFPITPGLLTNGTNTVTLKLPGLTGVTVEGMWLDAFSLRYARGTPASGTSAAFEGDSTQHAYSLTLTSTTGLRAYDVGDPDQPQRLNNFSIAGNTLTLGDPASDLPRRYAVTADSGILSPTRIRPASPLLTAGNTGADYVIITPLSFTPALTGLVTLRQSQGLTVTLEDVQAIYDAYGGRPEAEAIRSYLADVYATWTPRPSYVLLVGDGTFDPKRYRLTTPPSIIPPYLADVDPWAGETAADNRYVTVDGVDNLPDLLIGRLPVSTVTQTQVVVNKLIQYETQPAAGRWNGDIAFVADDTDSAGNFAAQSDILANAYVAWPFIARRVYYTPPAPVADTRQAVLNRWNAGAGLLMFTGHSSVHQWAAERLFHLDDVIGLTNAGRLPVVLEMTCFTGSFQNPSYPTLDESLLRAANGGAVAVWGPTGLGVSTGHASLADGFLDSTLVDGQTDLGFAALSGKLSVATYSPSSLDLIDTFTLLGDPATQLNDAVGPALVYLPLARR